MRIYQVHVFDIMLSWKAARSDSSVYVKRFSNSSTIVYKSHKHAEATEESQMKGTSMETRTHTLCIYQPTSKQILHIMTYIMESFNNKLIIALGNNKVLTVRNN